MREKEIVNSCGGKNKIKSLDIDVREKRHILTEKYIGIVMATHHAVTRTGAAAEAVAAATVVSNALPFCNRP